MTPTTPQLDVSDLFPHIAGALCVHVHPSYQHEAWQRMVDAIAAAQPKPYAKPGNGPGGINEYRTALRWALDYIDAFAMPHGGQYEDEDYQRAAALVGDGVFEYPMKGMWHRGNRAEIEAEYPQFHAVEESQR